MEEPPPDSVSLEAELPGGVNAHISLTSATANAAGVDLSDFVLRLEQWEGRLLLDVSPVEDLGGAGGGEHEYGVEFPPGTVLALKLTASQADDPTLLALPAHWGGEEVEWGVARSTIRTTERELAVRIDGTGAFAVLGLRLGEPEGRDAASLWSQLPTVTVDPWPAIAGPGPAVVEAPPGGCGPTPRPSSEAAGQPHPLSVVQNGGWPRTGRPRRRPEFSLIRFARCPMLNSNWSVGSSGCCSTRWRGGSPTTKSTVSPCRSESARLGEEFTKRSRVNALVKGATDQRSLRFMVAEFLSFMEMKPQGQVDQFGTQHAAFLEALESHGVDVSRVQPESSEGLGGPAERVHPVDDALDSTNPLDFLTEGAAVEPGLGEPMLFISHASDYPDNKIAEALVDLVEATVEPKPRIVCTSVEGHKLKTGADPKVALRTEIEKATVMLGLITPRSLRSSWVQFELGAAWFSKTTVFPVLQGVTFADLPAALEGRHALLSEAEKDVVKLVEDLADELGATTVRSSNLGRYVERFVEASRKHGFYGKLTS